MSWAPSLCAARAPRFTLTRAGGRCLLRRVRGLVVACSPGACSPGRGPLPGKPGPPSSPEATGEESLGGSRFLVCMCVWFAAGLLTLKQAARVSWVSWGRGCAWSIGGRWTSVVVGAGSLLPQPALPVGAVGGGGAPWAAGGSLSVPHEVRQARQLLPGRGWVSVEWRQLGTWACGQPSAVGSRDPRLALLPREPDMTWVCWGRPSRAETSVPPLPRGPAAPLPPSDRLAQPSPAQPSGLRHHCVAGSGPPERAAQDHIPSLPPPPAALRPFSMFVSQKFSPFFFFFF